MVTRGTKGWRLGYSSEAVISPPDTNALSRHAELQAHDRRRQRDGLLSLRILVDREALVRALVNRDAAG